MCLDTLKTGCSRVYTAHSEARRPAKAAPGSTSCAPPMEDHRLDGDGNRWWCGSVKGLATALRCSARRVKSSDCSRVSDTVAMHPLYSRRGLRRVGGEEWARSRITKTHDRQEIMNLMKIYHSCTYIQTQGALALRALTENPGDKQRNGFVPLLDVIVGKICSVLPHKETVHDHAKRASKLGSRFTCTRAQLLTKQLCGRWRSLRRADTWKWARFGTHVSWSCAHIEERRRPRPGKDVPLQTLPCTWCTEFEEDMGWEEEVLLLHSATDPAFQLGRGKGKPPQGQLYALCDVM